MPDRKDAQRQYSQPFFVGINNPRGFRGVNADGYLPALEAKPEEPEPIVKSKSIYFKIDRGALDLNRRVFKLESSNRYLLKKIKELTTIASKGKPIDIQRLSNIYI